MTGEREYPGIQLTYAPRIEDVDVLPYLTQAATSYVSSRSIEEAPHMETSLDSSSVSLKLTRSVLERISYAEIMEEAEKMMKAIATDPAITENDAADRIRSLGYDLLEPLPERE